MECIFIQKYNRYNNDDCDTKETYPLKNKHDNTNIMQRMNVMKMEMIPVETTTNINIISC